MNKTYYIDPFNGDDGCDGQNEKTPKRDYKQLNLCPGDSVLFKCGTRIRGGLLTCSGDKNGHILYGAYGEGEKPVFIGSEPANDAAKWSQIRPNIWKYDHFFSNEAANLIFNGGESCGNFRWSVDELEHEGEWYYSSIWENARRIRGINDMTPETDYLYLYSEGNPAKVYKSIECSMFMGRMVGGESYIILENLVFKNNGIHGYREVNPNNIIIRGCEFRFIGGSFWIREGNVRLGNGIEMWEGGSDILVENCIFDNIYDSGVTHQGNKADNIPERLYFRNNLFTNNGMAAYECRGPAAKEVYFENNVCINAGGGFSMQGEEPPRKSEIYPQPMGHHIFIWRMEDKLQKGNIYIRNNIFYEAPYGAAIYSIVSKDVEDKFIIDGNHYFQKSGDILNRIDGKLFKKNEFDSYINETDFDKSGTFGDLKLLSKNYDDIISSTCDLSKIKDKMDKQIQYKTEVQNEK